jgi:hypothetical protein
MGIFIVACPVSRTVLPALTRMICKEPEGGLTESSLQANARKMQNIINKTRLTLTIWNVFI